MARGAPIDPILDGLNDRQLEAVEHGVGPLLIVAGAGTGKTKTLVHRVARVIAGGIDPRRILLLTFTRRAAAEMLRRVDTLLGRLPAAARGAATASGRPWGGTFHAVAARLLRLHGPRIGLDPDFTIHDRADSEDLLDVVRSELDLATSERRFPRKSTCMAIYSHAVNSRRPLEEVLAEHYPWCAMHADDLRRLFRAYVERKDAGSVLDYDDLILFWQALVADEREGAKVRERFDRVFVDEYQDTNRLQAEILEGLCPDGAGLTVVGDDAQSIYSFRAATVRNILDFPTTFPGSRVVTLEQNYRSTPPILAATNAVIAAAQERYTKDLWSSRKAGERPLLVTCQDDNEQAERVIREVLEHREQGSELRCQAVLFRASHHSIALEAELGRRGIPFVKYGGLKFVETAHVKDLMAFLRLAENPRDLVSGGRVLMLLPGVGPRRARGLMDALISARGSFRAWSQAAVPGPARATWPKLVRLMRRLTQAGEQEIATQVHQVRRFYAPIAADKFDHAEPRLRDLEQLEQLAGRYPSRRAMLAEIALDPPTSTEELAGPPELDEDYLVLSTIHSAKGLEWDAVYVIHAADGNIPSDLATGSSEQIEEERRLFYVALTRARKWLTVCFPLRYYFAARGGLADDHAYAQLTRFITPEVERCFDRATAGRLPEEGEQAADPDPAAVEEARSRVRKRVRSMWS